MAGFFARLFGGGKTAPACCFVGHWCSSPLQFSNKIVTPLGSKVTKVTVCVDIWYSAKGDEIEVDRVQLSQGGSTLGDTGVNVATMRGEAFFAKSICDAQMLKLAVENDLNEQSTGLHKRMLAKWRGVNSTSITKSLVDVLNSNGPADQITELIAGGGKGSEIVFNYTKQSGDSEARHVTIEGVSGDSIRARDHKDGKVKNFRIERISKARKP